ncbi:MAG: hypothetical protein A2Y25_00165 [Candidatus Melainabacteria bacterium GWF2_37_15]|nr:MAG: hypothetical protein A2Y25_00165 [Candidatus Melainabacteria bacterium GWF2_37_15]
MNTCISDKEDLGTKSHNKRRLNRLQKRRNIRKVRILTSRLRVFTRIIFLIVIVWVFLKVINLSYWYLDENIFTVYPNRYLELEGNKIISNKQIMEKLQGITLPKKPLYLIDTTPIEEKLLKMAPVKKVFVRRYWLPARLRIVIDENTPVLSIVPTQKAEPVAVFTKDGTTVKVLGKKYLPLPNGYHTYKVITYDDYKSWKPVLIPYIEKLAIFLESVTADKLVYIDIRNPDDVYIQMKNIRLRIGALKGKEVFKRIEKVASVIPEAMKIKETINYIDLRWNNVSIKLKKKDEEPLIKDESTPAAH